MCVCVSETKLACMRGFTAEARPLRFRRIKVTGKNQQGRKYWAPCLIHQHLAKHKHRGGAPTPAPVQRHSQSHIAGVLQIRTGSVSINKSPEKKKIIEPFFTLRPFFPLFLSLFLLSYSIALSSDISQAICKHLISAG